MMQIEEPKVEISEYRISFDKNLHVHVKLHKDGKCSVVTNHQQDTFMFKKSNPEMISKIALLLLKAGEIAQKGREQVIEK